jgi:hypothetical protein
VFLITILILFFLANESPATTLDADETLIEYWTSCAELQVVLIGENGLHDPFCQYGLIKAEGEEALEEFQNVRLSENYANH